jgi:soluble epoxide hydrolase / lipid-phosphate phosphatase
MVKAHPRLAYQLFFDKQTSAATDELDRDIRRTLRGTLRDVASPPPESFLTSPDTYIGAWDGVDEVCFSVSRAHVSANLYLQIPPIPFFSKEEEDYWVEQYSISGFKYSECPRPSRIR